MTARTGGDTDSDDNGRTMKAANAETAEWQTERDEIGAGGQYTGRPTASCSVSDTDDGAGDKDGASGKTGVDRKSHQD